MSDERNNDKDTVTDGTMDETTETVIAEDYVTVTRRIPTRRHYLETVAPMLEATVVYQLYGELRRFLQCVSCHVEDFHWEFDHRHRGQDGQSVGKVTLRFSPEELEIGKAPWPTELPQEVVLGLTDEMRQNHPLFAELCDKWIGIWVSKTGSLEEAYDDWLESRQELCLASDEWHEQRNKEKLDFVAYDKARDTLKTARERQVSAITRYRTTVNDAMKSIACIAECHMNEACRRIREDDGYEEWLRENVTKDSTDGTERGDTNNQQEGNQS